MTSFMKRSVKYYFIIKAAKQIKKEIEKMEMDNLKTLAEDGISIVHTYFNNCSPQERATYRRELKVLVQMGITPDMILEEMVRQMPELAPEMEGKESYKQAEIKELESFLRGEE